MIRPRGCPGQVFGVKPDSGRGFPARCVSCLMTVETPDLLGPSRLSDGAISHLPGELRKLSWDHVDLENEVIHVWRSASRTGDVKTPKSKRSLVLPKRAVATLQAHKKRQAAERLAAGAAWQDNNLVFCHEDGRMYTSDELNWWFSKMTRRAGIGHWYAHEGRHTAVSIMSSNGVPLQEISDAVGHKSTRVTETVYRHVIVPAIRGGATVMDAVFGEADAEDNGDNEPGATTAWNIALIALAALGLSGAPCHGPCHAAGDAP
jgi:hypothetical protein